MPHLWPKIQGAQGQKAAVRQESRRAGGKTCNKEVVSPKSSSKSQEPGSGLIRAHNAIPTGGADKAPLLAVMRAAMRVPTHAGGKIKFLPDRRNIDEAIKVDPLATIV